MKGNKPLFALAAVLALLPTAVSAQPRADDPVTICHKGWTITVDAAAVDKHVEKHGDTLGACADGGPPGPPADVPVGPPADVPVGPPFDPPGPLPWVPDWVPGPPPSTPPFEPPGPPPWLPTQAQVPENGPPGRPS